MLIESANFIDSHFSLIINNDRKISRYSEDAKTALVRPTYKKDDRNQVENYRPVNVNL